VGAGEGLLAGNGFLLAMDQANLGIMETDWAENRAKLPQDFIRNTLGKVFDSLYSTGERDKFRTRLERNANGGTEIFISHRGMIEVYDSARKKTSTVWQPRRPTPSWRPNSAPPDGQAGRVARTVQQSRKRA
jgi:outer membrane protein assembly factor BamC